MGGTARIRAVLHQHRDPGAFEARVDRID